VEESLQRLGLDSLDLLLLHWPEAWAPGSSFEAPQPDAEASLRDTWAAMEVRGRP
jgi:diketogulonate reductase-like aldo/keto reductase